MDHSEGQRRREDAGEFAEGLGPRPTTFGQGLEFDPLVRIDRGRFFERAAVVIQRDPG